MTEYTKLTESEKQEIVKEYKKRFNTAIAIEISAFLLLGIMVLVKEYFNVKVNTIYALMTVPVIIFCFGCAMQTQLLKCPVCEYEEIAQYIAKNPQTWREDSLYCEDNK